MNIGEMEVEVNEIYHAGYISNEDTMRSSTAWMKMKTKWCFSRLGQQSQAIGTEFTERRSKS